MRNAIYKELVLHGLRVCGANVDPDRVPSRRPLAVGHAGGLREVPFRQVSEHLADSDLAPEDHFAELLAELGEDEYWKDSHLLALLRTRSEELADLLADPAEAGDPNWRIFEASESVTDILNKMYRRLDREGLDDGLVAALFLVRQLDGVADSDIALLLAESNEFVAGLRIATDRAVPAEAPWDEARACLVAQVVYDLGSTTEAEGIIEWFAGPRDDFDGRSPLEIIHQHGAHDVESELRRLARLSRGQIAA